MRYKHNRILFLLTVLIFVASYATAADSSDVKALFDRYQAVHRQYQEAATSGATDVEINDLAAQLNQARINYYRAIGVDIDDSTDIEAEKFQTSEPDPESTEIGTNTRVNTTSKKHRSPDEQEFAEILAELAKPDAHKNLNSIIKRLENLIERCKDPELKRDAVFKLADLIFDDTSNLGASQNVLLKYAQSAQNPELRRQAFARIRMLKKKAVVKNLRDEYTAIQSTATEKWGSFSKSSWLAVPVKLWKLASYGTSNVRRRFKAKMLQKALADYDKALLDTYPKGSADELTRSQLIPFNRVRMLVNGRTSFHYRMEYAKRAQSTLYVQTLLFQDDVTGNELTDIMCERAQNGVDVRLILDDFFSFGKKDGVIQRLKNAGVKVLINNPILKNIFKANFRSHQKLFIIDETIAIVGGMNIGAEYAKGELTEYGWRDTDVEVRGPIVIEILELFNRNWEELTLDKSYEKGYYEKYKKAKTEVTQFKGLKNVDKLIRGPIPVYFEVPPVFEDVDARFVITAPIDEKDDNILDLFEVYLSRAKNEVIFESAYFIPTDRLKHAIRVATAKGVKVIIITNSIESNNHPSGGWAGRRSYAEVMQSGARIFEWQGAQTLHSKVSLFDNFAVTLGAYNVNSRSHSSDSEDIIAFEDRRLADAFRNMLMKDLSRCKEVSMEDVAGWNEEFMKKMQMEFFNLFKFMF